MSIESLKNTFYYEKNGVIISDVDLVRGDCLPLNTYIVLKHKYTQIDNLHNLLVDDINFSIHLLNDGHIMGIVYKNDSIRKSGILKYTDYEYINRGVEAIDRLEEFIDNEGYIMIQTVNEWLPYSIHYDSSYKFDSYRPGHIQIMIGYDAEQFYFVEDPAVINYQKFYAYSKDIGIIDRGKAIEVIGTYLNCINVNIDLEKYKNIDLVVYEIIKESEKSYQTKNEYNEDGSITYYGRNAIKCLMDISNQQYIHLNDVDKRLGPINLYLRWKFRAIKNKRHLMYLFFKDFERRYYSTSITSLLQKDYLEWNKVWNIFEKRFMQQKYLWDQSIVKYFENILKIEDDIFSELRGFYI